LLYVLEVDAQLLVVLIDGLKVTES